MNRISTLLCALFTLFMSQSAAFAGSFFNISATGTPANLSITLCLNGNGPLSCQNHTVSALNLSINTTIPNHTYPAIGIKVNTPGYVLSGCTTIANGYCLFSADNTTAANLVVNTVTAHPEPQETLIATANPSSIAYGNTSALSTTGGSGDGTVTYTVTSGVTNCEISGATLTGIGIGTCTVTATKGADSNYLSTTSSPIIVTVATPTPTTTVVYSSLNSSATTSPITLSAKIISSDGTPDAGNVGFTADGMSIGGCTAQLVTSGIATCTTTSLAIGSHAIVATYSGGSTFASSTSASFSQSVVSAVTATVPAAPQNVTAIPGNGRVIVNWYPPANTGGAAITGYTVNYGTTASETYHTTGCTTSSESDLSCAISSGLTNGTPYTFTVAATNSNGMGPAAFSSSVVPESTLTASPSSLALSGLGTGASRTITITNNSGSTVTISSLSISPSLPSGTTMSASQANACTSGLVLANDDVCTITISPGSTVSSGAGNALCSTGIAPTPSVITVTDNNNDIITADVVVLGYGCQYQEGYLFSIDDTTPITSSIGGKVVTLSDQSSGIVWSIDTVSIWGIDDTSTIGTPSPNTTSSQSATLATGQLNCDAVNDGACATNNVFVYYGAVSNAVGTCKLPINGYTDWYLPSVCELGPFGSTGFNTGNYPSYLNSQTCATGSTNIQNQLAGTSIVTNFNAGYYWSSTEYSGVPQFTALRQLLASNGADVQVVSGKTSSSGVRCSRGLTL